MIKKYPEEKGSAVIHGEAMSWIFRRSKGQSAFGLRGSRIFELTLMKGDKVVGKYNRGWEQQISKEDEAAALCISYLVDKYGREEKSKKKKEKRL